MGIICGSVLCWPSIVKYPRKVFNALSWGTMYGWYVLGCGA